MTAPRRVTYGPRPERTPEPDPEPATARTPRGALAIQCPRCAADPGWPCVSLRRGTRGLVDTKRPHRERVAAARDARPYVQPRP